MATHYNQKCPLCDSPAEYCWVDGGNVKYFNCPDCGMFQISRRAEKVLAEKHSGRKSTYAIQVRRTPEDHLLFIRMPSDKFRQKSDDPLQAEFTPKSELSVTCR